MTIATDLERYLLDRVNEFRADNGLHALTLEQNLNQAATTHSQWLLDNQVFTHTGPVSATSPNGSTGLDRMVEAGWDQGSDWTWGENIGAEPIRNSGDFFDEVDTIFLGWVNSPGHRANLLNPDVDLLGVGIVQGILPPASGVNVAGIMATQNFGASNGLHDLDILGQSGADTLTGGNGDDDILGGAGNDLISARFGDDFVAGGEGNDTIESGRDNDTLEGDAGNDFLRGGAGDDQLSGGEGNDDLIGDAGNDQMTGDNGQDTLSGREGNDWLDGGAGFDVLLGGSGNDTLMGGEQADNLFASTGDDWLEGGAGFDRLFGGADNDTLFGGDGPDALYGNAGNDQMFGEDGDDRSYGGSGDDLISSGEGDDLLIGGGGFDTLKGGAGDDTLEGRFNADRFVFSDIASGFGNDTITDFAATNQFERIDLSDIAAITNLNDLLNNHAQQIGADVLITAGAGSTILLEGVDLGQLDSTDFIF